MTIADINEQPRRPEPTGGPNKLVPGRYARSLAEVWRLTPEQVAAEHERLSPPRRVAPPPPAVEAPAAPRIRIVGTPDGWPVAKEAAR